ncbi:DUF927 domain-containing protein [Acinetobacter sp. LMB-5]|uniref:DUF927 domain-containing protein n=1 Tax=Acinetobacter sp. LMB-5 TaxID=1609919 RepID=UPI0007611123|nr:DUF927 domain-containing protein [Acinetobacter sp. LMB-5]
MSDNAIPIESARSNDKPKHQLADQWLDAHEVKLGIPPAKPWSELSQTVRTKVIAELDKRLKELEKANKASSKNARLEHVEKMLEEPKLTREVESFINRVIASLPQDYEYNRQAQRVNHIEWKMLADGMEKKIETPVCSALAVTAITYSEDEREGGLLVEWVTRGGKVAKWSYPQSILAQDFKAIAESLQRQRIPFLPHDATGKRLFMELLQNSIPEKQVLHTEKTGWTTGGSFVFPDYVLGSEEVVFQATSSHHQPPVVKGSIKDWNDKIGKYCKNNPTLVLGVGVALSSPLIGLIGLNGSVFHLIGESSKGKTLSVGVNCSVFGMTKGSWKGTDNAKESEFESRNHIGTTLDELGQATVKDAFQTTYMLGNGQGRQRANKDGSPQRIRKFNLNALSTGELSLDDYLGKADLLLTGGLGVRFIQGVSDCFKYGCFDELHGFSSPEEFAQYIETVTGIAGDNYSPQSSGALGMEYIKHLADSVGGNIEKIAAIKKRIGQHADALTPDGSDSQIKRMAKNISAVIVSLEIAIKAGLIEWDVQEPFNQVSRWWHECVLPTRGGNKSTEKEKAIQAVKDFLDLKGHLHFARLGLGDNEKPMDIQREQYGFVETLNGVTTYYVNGAGFKKMCVGFDTKKTAKALYEADLLVTTESMLKKDSYQCQKKVNGKNSNYYIINIA